MSANGYNRPGTSPLSKPHSTISGNDFGGQYIAFENGTGLDSLLQICAVSICKNFFQRLEPFLRNDLQYAQGRCHI